MKQIWFFQGWMEFHRFTIIIKKRVTKFKNPTNIIMLEKHPRCRATGAIWAEKYVITEIDFYKIIFTLIKKDKVKCSSQLFKGKRFSEIIRSLYYYRSAFLQMNFVALRWTDSMSIKMMTIIASCSKKDIWILLSLNSP
jgi:hypothetical protein